MESRTGGWVAGDDFFGRETGLRILGAEVQQGNHLLLSGPRRTGKTSVARELGRRLAREGWTFLYLDVEHTGTPGDFVRDFAAEVRATRPFVKRRLLGLGRWVGAQAGRVQKVGAAGASVEVRREVEPGTWRRRGARLFRECARSGRRVFLVVDELPLFLKRLLETDGGREAVELFLSWLRGSLQMIERNSPVLMICGSVGLYPFVERLRLTDRVNYLSPYRLEPWSREESIECLEALAETHGISWAPGVASAVYERLGEGNPHHVQCFFSVLRRRAVGRGDFRIEDEDIEAAYVQLLRPDGPNDLAHYEHRLEQSLDVDGFDLAKEILVETAKDGVLTRSARESFAARCRPDDGGGADRVRRVLDVLLYDGYLVEAEEHGLRFGSRLLRDWFAAGGTGEGGRGRYAPRTVKE